jgi:hypothetical protein
VSTVVDLTTDYPGLCLTGPMSRRHPAPVRSPRYLDLVREARTVASMPLAIQLSPYLPLLPDVAADVGRAGADGLVPRSLQPGQVPGRTMSPASVSTTVRNIRCIR